MTSLEPATERYVSLATFRRNGKEVRTPVWIASGGDSHYVFSEADAGKVKRIRANGRVALAACNIRGVVRGEWHQGTASLVGDPDSTSQAYAALHEKYGWQMKLLDVISKLAGKYHNRALIEIRLAR